MKKTIKIIGIIIGSVIIFNILLIPFAMIGMEDIKALKVTTPDLTNYEDSAYSGYYGKGRWQYDVLVSVSKNKISDIKLNKSKFPTPDDLNKKIIDEIITKQSLSIDAVSGASVNTKALCKAVEVALVNK